MAQKAQTKTITKKVDLKAKTIEELKKEIAEIEKDIFDMEIDNKRKKLGNTTSIRRKKDEIARMLTVVAQKELTKNG